MANKITWVIDHDILERHDDVGFPPIDEAARAAGHDVIMKKYVPFSDELLFTAEDLEILTKEQPLLAYGTVGFINQFQRNPNYRFRFVCPGAYLQKDELKFSKCAAMYGEFMLNEDFIMLPYAELKRRVKEDVEYDRNPRRIWHGDKYGPHKLFIRPDVVTKSFAGRLFDFGTDEDDINALDKYMKIDPNEICIIAEEKEIQAEYRHVICNHELIAQSQYQRDGRIDIRIDVDPECQRLAKYVSRCENEHNWEPDYVYVVDTCMTPDGARIVEFNSFSCSGLYACDTNKIVERVSEQARREYEGDLD